MSSPVATNSILNQWLVFVAHILHLLVRGVHVLARPLYGRVPPNELLTEGFGVAARKPLLV